MLSARKTTPSQIQVTTARSLQSARCTARSRNMNELFSRILARHVSEMLLNYSPNSICLLFPTTVGDRNVEKISFFLRPYYYAEIMNCQATVCTAQYSTVQRYRRLVLNLNFSSCVVYSNVCAQPFAKKHCALDGSAPISHK